MKDHGKQHLWMETFGLIGSLAGFYIAKGAKKEAVPGMLVGGFLGGLIGNYFQGIESKPKGHNSQLTVVENEKISGK